MFSTKNLALALSASLLSGVLTLPIRREVPQEHSHQKFLDTVTKSLQLNNPDEIQDAVFGLLGNAAAAAGQGKITDTDCLQQATADQAFTNAKAAGDVAGMTAALIYRALERNTGKVGQASVPCTAIQAVNPEIAAIQQHQDPASNGAAATNKAIALTLAQQIVSVGGDPQDALEAGTFAPGDLNDATAAGNTCDVADDSIGCIFTQNLLQPDATADEINAAVAGGAASASAGANSTVDNTATDESDASDCPATLTVTATGIRATATEASSGAAGSVATTSAGAAPSASAATSSAAATTSASAAGTATASSSAAGSTSAAADTNLQAFTGNLGGAPPIVTANGGGFVVEGSSDFQTIGAAIQRSCDIQHNACANAANSGSGFSVGQCDQQDTKCVAANKA